MSPVSLWGNALDREGAELPRFNFAFDGSDGGGSVDDETKVVTSSRLILNTLSSNLRLLLVGIKGTDRMKAGEKGVS